MALMLVQEDIGETGGHDPERTWQQEVARDDEARKSLAEPRELAEAVSM